MKKLLALSMAFIMVISLSVIALAQNRPEVTPVQNHAGEQIQTGQNVPTVLPDESSEDESDTPSETFFESQDESESFDETVSESPSNDQSTPEPSRRQKIEELMAGLAAGRAERIAERTMAIEEKRAVFEQKKQEMLQRREEALQNRMEFQNKKEEFAQFKNMLQEHREQAISNMHENNRLRAEISKLREEVKNSLEALSLDEIELSEDTRIEIEALTEQIAILMENLMSTKDSIGGAVSQAAQSRKDLDYENMEFAFEQLREVQSYRNECMEEIIESLRSILQLLASEA